MSEDFNENVEATAVIVEQPKVEVKIGDWLTAGWELFTKDWLKVSLSVLITVAMSLVTCGILVGPMAVGLYKCFIKKVKGEDYELGELFEGVKTQFLPSFILVLAFIICGVVLNIIPCVGPLLGIAFNLLAAPILAYSLFEIAVATETIEIGSLIDLSKRIYEKLKPQYFMFVLWFLLVGIIGSLGTVACCVGVFASTAIVYLAVTVSYAETFGLSKKTEVEAEIVNEETVEV